MCMSLRKFKMCVYGVQDYLYDQILMSGGDVLKS